jgi:hypothetical protein
MEMNFSYHRKSNFLRRIPEEEWIVILRKLHRAPSPEESEAFSFGKWDHPIFCVEGWIYRAFYGYLQGTWNVDVMSKLFLYDACQRQVKKNQNCKKRRKPYLLKSYQLINSQGEVDQSSLELLSAATAEYLNPQELASLIERLSQIAPEQTQFFAVERLQDDLFDSIARKPPIGRLHWTFLTAQTKNRGNSWRSAAAPSQRYSLWQVVASPEFIYAIHQAKFKKNAIRPIPILGYSPIEILSNPDARIVCIPSIVSVPEKAHLRSCEPLGMYHHDIAYHHALESANMHRPVWIAFAKFLREKGKELMAVITLDRDLLPYVRLRKEEIAETFWISLEHQFLLFLVAYKREEPNGYPPERVKAFAKSFIDEFCEFYERNNFQREYGLTLKSLEDSLDTPLPWYASILSELSLRRTLYEELFTRIGG